MRRRVQRLLTRWSSRTLGFAIHTFSPDRRTQNESHRYPADHKVLGQGKALRIIYRLLARERGLGIKVGSVGVKAVPIDGAVGSGTVSVATQ